MHQALRLPELGAIYNLIAAVTIGDAMPVIARDLILKRWPSGLMRNQRLHDVVD
jgi:hypothetical protein